MVKRKSTQIGIRETGFPSFIAAVLALSNPEKRAMVKSMLSSKWTDTMGNILNAIRVGHNKGSHAFSAGFLECDMNLVANRAPFAGFLHFCNGLWIVFFTKTKTPQPVAGFLADGMTHMCSANFLDRFCRVLHPQIGGLGRFGEIKAPLTKWLEGIKPVLFSLKQKSGQYQLDHLKNKALFAVFIPCALQMVIAMVITVQLIEVIVQALLQVSGTADVKLACNCASNAVDTRCIGKLRIHQPTPLVSTLIGALPGSQGHSSSHGFMRPMLGNSSTIAFSARVRKAEEFAKAVS